MDFLRSNFDIFSFWWEYFWALDSAVPRDASTFGVVPGRWVDKTTVVDAGVVERYNGDYDALKKKLRERGVSGDTSKTFFWFQVFAYVRLLAAFFFFQKMWVYGWIALFSSFLVLPYSFIASITFAGVSLPLQLPFNIVASGFQFYVMPLLPEWVPLLQFEMTIPIMFGILGVDFLLSFMQYLKSKTTDPLWVQLYIGFLNSRVGVILVLCAMHGQTFSLLPFFVHTALVMFVSPQFSELTSIFPPVPITFYHSHRTNHLPGVYTQSHKLHHTLKDGTPFDAHFIGLSLPEGSFYNFCDVATVMYGHWPSVFCFGNLMFTLQDKAVHSRNEKDTSVHVNHHANPKINFSTLVSEMLDCIMGTVQPELTDSNGVRWRTERKKVGSKLEITFQKNQ